MKILLLDIETAPNTAYVWGLFKENIPLARLVDSGYVMCWAAKWLGEDEIFFDSVYQSRPKAMLKKIHMLLEQADAVVHYNGTRFDIPTLNKEFILQGWPPPAPYKEIDLLLTAKRRFRFASNKLDYVAKALGVGKKHEHAGFQLWIQCMAGDAAAWDEMKAYNKNDVVLLEDVYNVFLPWIKNHPNVGVYDGDEDLTCPHCGGKHFRKRGFTYTKTQKYQRYQCKGCGSWSRSKKAVKMDVQLVTEYV